MFKYKQNTNNYMNHFQNLLIWALPASGKSEILTVLRGLNPAERLQRLHINNPVEIDDYQLVAEWFKNDDIRETNNLSRVYTGRRNAEGGGFKTQQQWNHLTMFLNLQYKALLAGNPNIHSDSTVLLECARGGPENASFPLPYGYEQVIQVLDNELLRNAAILYVQVSPEESKRRNRARHNPNDPLGTLGHMVPEKVMRDEYGCDDIQWLTSQSKNSGFINVKGINIPIALFNNQDDKTSFIRDKNIPLEERQKKINELVNALEQALNPLFNRFILNSR